jgi:ParB/RepB/Spo0J family partition protein
MPLIPLNLIDENGHNIRRTPATAEQDEQLVQSIRTLGVLQPILLRYGDEPERYFVVAGHRRVRCALAAGLETIPAEVMRGDTAIYAASQAAENMVRVPMDPVDQWRAIVSLQEEGYSLQGAAQALGISERMAKRLDKLGHVAPEILDLMVGSGLPDQDDLAVIASAPIERQLEAFKPSKGEHPHDRLEMIARRCRTTRIPRNMAIFDVDASGILFEEDLFAEPGSDEQFTTGDVEGFIKAQKAALIAQINARKKKNERVALATWKNYNMVIPKGFTAAFGETKKRYPANGSLMLFMCVREDSGLLGAIEMRHATEDAKAVAKAAKSTSIAGKAAAEDDGENDADAATGVEVPAFLTRQPDPDEPALTKLGQTMLAAMKTDALCDSLDALWDGGETAPVQLPILAAALVLALSADNVTVAGGPNRFSRTRFDDLRPEIVSPPGTFIVWSEAEVARLIAKALSRILRVTDPVTNHGSGVVAEWIGAMIGAEQRLPRFDTAAFLACMGKDALQALAEQSGRGGLKTAKGLREALAGSLPDWRPASFGAPGPTELATPDINNHQEDAA